MLCLRVGEELLRLLGCISSCSEHKAVALAEVGGNCTQQFLRADRQGRSVEDGEEPKGSVSLSRVLTCLPQDFLPGGARLGSTGGLQEALGKQN